MARKDPILYTIFKKVKEDSMETQQGVQMLENLLENYALKDVLKEAMTLITLHCTTKGPNLHVAQAHIEKNPTTLRTTIFRT
jgi:hypothetical protein